MSVDLYEVAEQAWRRESWQSPQPRALKAAVDAVVAALGDPTGEHRIELRADGWTIQHPLTCRPDLFACEMNRAVADRDTGLRGVFVCDLDDDGRIRIGERRV